MRQYRIDEIRPDDYHKLKEHLDASYGPCLVDGIYWVPLEDHLLDAVQAAHTDCHPHCFAIELRYDSISFELLIRTRQRVRCDCINYANGKQRESIIRYADALFERLKLLI